MIRTAPFTVVVSSLVVVAAACGGSTKKTTAPVKVTTKPVDKPVKKKPPPPPVCVAQSELAVIGMSAADDGLVSFCVSDGNGGSPCYSLELDGNKLSKLPSPPIPQAATREAPAVRLQATPSEVEVCPVEGEGKCARLKPKGKGGDNPIEAAVNRAGTTVVMLLGDAERGKGVAEVWSVAKKKKVATIKYARGDYRCGTAHVVDELVFVSAGVCAGPAARGALYSAKGKKVADVGGADFGSYGAVPIEIGDHRWAFLSETAGVIAIHDSQTGALEKTIELTDLWAKVGDGMTGGNPGESVMLRGGDGKLVVITGSPKAGEVGVVDVESGAVEVVSTLACAAPAAEDAPDDADAADRGAGDGADDSGGDGAPEPASDLE